MEKDILEQLYYRYTRQVYLYLYSLCHNHAMAEDLMQDTFLKAFCSLETAGEEVLPWLLTVARNLYLDTWRKEKRMSGQVEQEHPALETELLGQMIRKERNQKLYQAILKLKDLEKEAIVLYYFSGLTQEKISRILNLSYGNTRVILYRAKQNLKNMLSKEEI